MNSLKPFKGSNVFMSRNLVPPEIYDSLHDALKLNGAEVFLCCDPSRNSPNDFHVIASMEHEKFEDLRAKGCNLLGPQCVLSCAKERRALPKLGFVCCLAMDGVKVVASGFDKEERARIGKLVIAMGGSFHTRTSMDVTFVIVKSVLAGKYKWAAENKERHIVTIDWLHQCWKEHRVVPVESYRVPPFSGLIICVSGIHADQRKEMEKLTLQYGGKYSAQLTKLCTHLVCEVPEGDKFKVARKWGTVRIVSRHWFDQSVARRVCLNEEAYPVQSGSVSLKGKVMAKSGQDNCTRNSQSVLSSAATDSTLRAVPSAGNMDSDQDVALSQNFSSVYSNVKNEEAGPPDLPDNDTGLEGCVADDSETDDNDLYLSDCRICLVGFDASDMRKLVGMVRKGGGSRYMLWSEKLTHIVVGAPSDVEKRELRGLAALGVIRFVRRNWLEDCDRQRREVLVLQKHVADDILLPKDLAGLSKKASAIGMSSIKTVDRSTTCSNISIDLTSGAVEAGTGISLGKDREGKTDINRNGSCSLEGTKRSPQSDKFRAINDKDTSQQKIQLGNRLHCAKSSNVFEGKKFCFSHSFPEDRREEIVQWISEGQGEVTDDPVRMHVDFTVQCHGVTLQSSNTSQNTYVSSHWIRSCLEDGRLLDVGSHILYSPLPCQIPLPGFQGLKFCVSQYTDKERLLLRNLCFVLGAKFAEKLTRKVTHLLCKFANGPKYEAACRWGIKTVTCEWLYECVRKGKVVGINNFLPNEVPQDPESGVCTVSQYPTQAGLMCRDNTSQVSSQSQDLRKENTESSCKRLRLSDLAFKSNQSIQINCTVVDNCEDAKGNNHVVPDVAAAIEDLLEETSKIQDLKSPIGTECDKSVFSSDCPILGREHAGSHSSFGPSKQWLSSLEKKEDPQNPSRDQSRGIHDGFSETQTDSQLVGYEEDLSGRQMIIDRVRTRSSMT